MTDTERRNCSVCQGPRSEPLLLSCGWPVCRGCAIENSLLVKEVRMGKKRIETRQYLEDVWGEPREFSRFTEEDSVPAAELDRVRDAMVDGMAEACKPVNGCGSPGEVTYYDVDGVTHLYISGKLYAVIPSDKLRALRDMVAGGDRDVSEDQP